MQRKQDIFHIAKYALRKEDYKMLYALIAVVLLLVNALCAYFMKQSAVMKGYGEDSHIWAICFWCGLFGYLYVISLPDKIQQNQNQQIIELLSKRKED